MRAAGKQPDFFATSVGEARRFFLDLAPNHSSPLEVVCGGYEDCRPDYLVDRETFPYFSIEMVTKGGGFLTLGGLERPIGPGDLFTYGPGVPHRIRPRQGSPMGKLFVDFVGRDAAPLLDRLGCPPGGSCRVSAASEVQLLWSELIHDGQRGDEASADLCAALLRCIVLRAATYRAPTDAAKPEPFETYQRCVDHITSNAATIASQQQAASECGVSPEYMSRLFKRYDRQSPYQLLKRLRMNLAAERLLDATVTVKQVAEELGYSDPFHFSRAFKATLGVSPTEFRKLR